MQTTAIMMLTAAMIGALSFVLARAKPAALDGETGAIRPDRASAWFTVIAGAAMFVLGAGATIVGHPSWGSVALAVMGAAAGGFMVPSLTSLHTVYWNADQIEGPSKMFGPSLGLARTAITWKDVVKTGTTFTGYDYVESHDGRRVYFSYLYKGHGALRAAIAQRCPSLE